MIDRAGDRDRDPALYDDSLPEDTRDDQSYDAEGPGAGTAGGAVGGAAAGAIAGTLIGGPLGTAVGAAVGAVGGAVVGRAAETIDDQDISDIDPGASTGLGPGVNATSAGAAMASAPGAAGIGAMGLPTASNEDDVRPSEAEIERRGGEKGPFDNPASYDETAADVATDRPILVSADPGYEAVDTDQDSGKRGAATTDYIRDRDDIAQGGEPR